MRKLSQRGKFIVVDGMDGAGKSVFLDTFDKELKNAKKKVFDVNRFWEKNDRLPRRSEVDIYDAIYTSEPTYYGVGKFLRNTLISNNSEVKYSTSAIAQAYALDRQVLYEGLILPFLNKKGMVFQSRSVSTSLVYQKLTGEKDGMKFEEVLALPGNQFALKNAPDFLIILTVEPEKVMERLDGRKKKDDAIFEKIGFQKKVKKEFESKWFRDLFEMHGTKVIYMDASKTVEYSQEQMRGFFQNEIMKK